MQPSSSRTGAWRTHHHRVTVTPGFETTDLSVLDIPKTLQ
jgi:hypothetical protein